MPNPNIDPPILPKCIVKLPASIIRALDNSEVFKAALASMNHPNEYGPQFALHSLASYFEAAQFQQRRIKRANDSICRVASKNKNVKPGRNLFFDIHFYLIAWQRILKLAEFIRDQTRFPQVGKVIRKYHNDLEERQIARHHLEHFEERVPGGKQQSKLRNPYDLKNLSNQYLTIGGSRVDIGSDSIRLLKSFYNEFLTALKYDSLETLAREDQNRLSPILHKAATQVNIARLTKQANRMLTDGFVSNKES